MTEWGENLILPALTPIIKDHGGKLCIRAIREYIVLLVATGGFDSEQEVKAEFNAFYRRGVFRLKGERKQLKPEHDNG